jgi:fumarylacetoacetase
MTKTWFHKICFPNATRSATDWSARDLQKWEYVPLGPFTAKSFATSISPWVVTWEALSAVRCPAPAQTLAPVLPYLTESDRHTFDVLLAVGIVPRGGRGVESTVGLCRLNQVDP